MHIVGQHTHSVHWLEWTRGSIRITYELPIQIENVCLILNQIFDSNYYITCE